jgi:hypothetical protein
VQEWVLPCGGAARTRQGVLLQDHTLHAFGGNRGASRDRFAPDQLTDEIWRIDLANLTATAAGRLPAPRQSPAAVTLSGSGTGLLLGGLGPAAGGEGEGKTVSQADGVVFAAGEEVVRTFAAALPTPRTQFHAIEHDGRLWVFGGIDFAPDASGKGSATYPVDVLVCDLDEEPARFVESGVTLPRPRRSFGAAKLGSKCYLIGGLGEGFIPAEGVDVFDFATEQWSVAPPPPRACVSPQVCVLDGVIYLACGGTMRGMTFDEDRTLASFHPEHGWTTAVAALPFPARHAHMFAWRDRLLFYTAAEDEQHLVIRTLVPPAAPLAAAAEAAISGAGVSADAAVRR